MPSPFSNRVEVITQTRRVVISQLGRQGPPGPSGASAAFGIAGEVISGHKAVALVEGKLYHADPTNIDHAGRVVGVSMNAAVIDDIVNYVAFGDVPGGSFTIDALYFVGVNGTLSTIPKAPGALWQQFVGVGKSSSVIAANLGQPVVVA